MIEVFKTNISCREMANSAIDEIQKVFPQYKANVDLHDCDNILRVLCSTGMVNAECLINFLADIGIQAEVLPDEILSESNLSNKKY